MLIALLKELEFNRKYSSNEIAKKLNTTPELIEDMISKLSSMGYIKDELTGASCETKCSGCSLGSICSTTPIRTIELTDKGKQKLKSII